MKYVYAVVGLLFSSSVMAADTDQGEVLNQRCAPCHGLYGQGAPGATAPRLAGLPSWYLTKATTDYIKGARKNPLMVDVSGLKQMSVGEISDLSRWLSAQEVAKDPAYDITMLRGNAHAGKSKFEEDCKVCHAVDGYGKKKKDAPPLTGQHSGYLLASMKAFFQKQRYHDNDPIDDTFDDISDAEARDILAWLATLDNSKQEAGYHFQPGTLLPAFPGKAGFKVTSVQQTVISSTARKGVTMPRAISALLLKAQELGVPKIPERPDNSQKLPMVVNLNFCAPHHIDKLLQVAPVLVNYDPCRVTLMHSPNGKLRLMTVSLDMLINAKQLPPDAQRMAIQINQDMLAILDAGAKGEGKTEQALPGQ